MKRLLAIVTTPLLIPAYLILAAVSGGLFMFAYPIFLLAALTEKTGRFARRLCR